ncbi:MAG: CoA transferase, partial [Pseudomonadales bacterium]|nr:CoA transferase [Pseudomonadales bacterium]
SLGLANDRLIRVSITPFGLTGAWHEWKGPAAVLLAMGGYTAIIGDPDREPLTIPGNYVHYQAGQYACIGAMAAMLEGRPACRTVEVSMLDVLLSLSQFTTVIWTCNREVRGRHGNGWSNLHPINLYPCRDGWFFVNIVPTFWEAFTQMLGRPELKDDPRFARSADRVVNREALDRIIVECLGSHTMNELLEMGQRQFRVPTGTLYSMADVLSDAHLQARHYFHNVSFHDVSDAAGLTVRSPSSPFRRIDGRDVKPMEDLTVMQRGKWSVDEVMGDG